MIVDLIEKLYRDLWNRWDDSAVGEVLAPTFRFRGSLGHTVEGRDGWRGYRDMVRNGSRDFRNEIVDLVISEERAAARLEYSGTHTGTLLDLAATGRRFTYAGAAFFTASADHLTDAWVLGDITALRAQLQ